MQNRRPDHRLLVLRRLLAALGLGALAQVQASPLSVPDPARSFGLAVSAFGFDLWRHAEAGNQALSPASIAVALSMTLAGARGGTAAAMARVLHLEGDAAGQHAQAAGMLTRWQSAGELLQVVNRLFVEREYTLEPPFVELVRSRYGAPVEALDFARAPARARDRINGWVAEQTRQRIRNLIPANGINKDTRLVLTNAIWLLAKWQRPFDASATRPADFFPAGGKAKQVPTMNARGRYAVGTAGDVQLLELPYREADLAMLFVLPEGRNSLAAVEAALSPERLATWVAALDTREAVVALPRFRVAPARSFALAGALKSMGMAIAFDAQQADFTGMADPPAPADRLYIAEVFHQAMVEVDEAGTEATAATAVTMNRAGAAMPTAAPFLFRADHPFLFLLRDNLTGAVLFIGRVTDP